MEAQLSRVAALNKTNLDATLDAVLLLAEGAEKRVIGRSRNACDIASGAGVQLLDLTHSASSELRKGFESALDGDSIAIGKTDAGSWAPESMLSNLGNGDGRINSEGLTRAAEETVQLEG